MKFIFVFIQCLIIILAYFESLCFAQIEAVIVDRTDRRRDQAIIIRRDGLRYFIDADPCPNLSISEGQTIYLDSRNGIIGIGTKIFFKNSNSSCRIYDIRPAR
jgi:hypothetical protein